MPKMNGFIKTFKVKEGGNKLMSLRIDDEKLLETYKTIWTQIENLKNIKLNALTVYDDRYIKTKTRTYGHKVYSNFCGLNVPEDDIDDFFSHFYQLFASIPQEILSTSIFRQLCL